jgi:hypothetical protein
MGRTVRTCIAISMCSLALGGCASYSSSFSVIQNDLADRQYDAALQEIEKQSTSKNNRVLYLLNKGMVLSMKGDFAASNRALEDAKDEMDRLYATSVSENVLSFVVNDTTESYAGDDYEQVLVHLYMALNYLELGQTDDARVEALQIDTKLREIGEKTPDSNYVEDAFSLYLTGMIYEDRGEWSDAMISYRQAYVAYKKYKQAYKVPIPRMLKFDLLRLSKLHGLDDELAEYTKEFGIKQNEESADTSEHGELVFVLNNGLAPIKRERYIDAGNPLSETKKRIAVPYYESRTNNVGAARITVDDNSAHTELMENIDAIAKSSLDARMPEIIARALARGGNNAKQNATQNPDNNHSSIMGTLWAMVVGTFTTQRADTRSWLTLPADIHMARLSLPPGEYNVKVELLGKGKKKYQRLQVLGTREYNDVTINKGKMTFLIQYWIPPQLHTKTPNR